MINIVSLNQKQQDYINLTISIIDACTQHCDYCYNKFKRTNNILDLNELLEYLTKSPQKLQLDILGGEPTLHPDLYEFCKKAALLPNIYKISIYTNCSANIDFYSKLLLIQKVFIIFSIHSYQFFKQHINFFNKIYLLSSNIEYRFMFNYEFIDCYNQTQCTDIFQFKNVSNIAAISDKAYDKYLIKYNKIITHVFNQLRFNNLYTKYKFNISNNIMTYGDIYLNAINNELNISNEYTKILCTAGIQQMYIHTNGDIALCESQYLNHNSILSNIYNQNKLNKFYLNKKPVLCYDKCACPLLSTKYLLS